MQVMQLADELGVSTVAVVDTCRALGITAGWAGAELSDDDAQRIRAHGVEASAAEPAADQVGPTIPFGPASTGVRWDEVATPAPPSATAARSASTRTPITVAPTVVRRRSDMAVEQGWGLWWRSLIVTVLTCLATGIVLLYTAATDVLRDAYQYRSATDGKLGIALVFVLFAAGMGWAATLRVRAASVAIDGWNHIGESDGALKGKGAITFITFTAVAGVAGYVVLLVFLGLVLAFWS